jgi:hypothetical protein
MAAQSQSRLKTTVKVVLTMTMMRDKPNMAGSQQLSLSKLHEIHNTSKQENCILQKRTKRKNQKHVEGFFMVSIAFLCAVQPAALKKMKHWDPCRRNKKLAQQQ